MELEDESVYNLLEKHIIVPPKPPMYKSKYPGNLPPTASTFCTHSTSKPGIVNIQGEFVDPDKNGGSYKIKKATATMGKSVKDAVEPLSFTKKNSGTSPLPSPQKFSYADAVQKPAIPSRDDKPIMGLKTSTNFIVTNAVENILSTAKKPTDTQINWTQKPDYGKAPDYLKDIKREIEEEYQYISQIHEKQQQKNGQEMQLLTEAERKELLAALQARWTKLNEEYCHESFALPAKKKSHAQQPPLEKSKRAKKERLEAEMAGIEKDIEKLSKPNIFIYNDSR